ncbi:MAG: formate dehydrogenase accessory sulfurtransferase FdhD [Coriobacteriia bacterium]|nr:formate dehydrogenase accessory sulfurtransferase FdhD [Coriobacteriia bacterium]
MQTETKCSVYSSVHKVTTLSRCGQRSSIDKNILNEKAVEVYINGVRSMRITCTPTDLKELVVGRLHSEGYISSFECIKSVDFTKDLSTVNVVLDREDEPGEKSLVQVIPSTGGNGEVMRRYASTDISFKAYDPIVWDKNAIFNLYEDFLLDTPLHTVTKGTHSCRLAVDGTIVFISEDIGRHNAFDKAIGYTLIHSIDITRTLFFISGRIPVDMVSKAIRARIPVLATKAAPTDQAVMLAQNYGLTLIGLVNANQLLVFSGAEFESTKES